MLGTKTDKKNIEIIKLVAQLRDHIDIHRIIGLNVDSLQNSDISNAFIGYLQKAAQESLPQTVLALEQRAAFFAFGKKYGNDVEPTEAKSHLKVTFGLFCGVHFSALDRLKEFRDTIGAHSDSKGAIDSLPSHAEFETLYSFAADFYELVSRSLLNAGPAMVPRQAGKGLVKLMESMGVKAPKFDFEADE